VDEQEENLKWLRKGEDEKLAAFEVVVGEPR
jgi:hypothetical protein